MIPSQQIASLIQIFSSSLQHQEKPYPGNIQKDKKKKKKDRLGCRLIRWIRVSFIVSLQVSDILNAFKHGNRKICTIIGVRTMQVINVFYVLQVAEKFCK
jgi:hypothetical protein